MIKSILVFIFMLTLTTNAFAKDISIQRGESQEIQLTDFVKVIDLSKDKIVSISKGKDKSIIIVQAKRRGKVTMKVTLNNNKTEEFSIKVTPRPSSTKARKVRKELKGIEGLKIEIVGSKVYLSGRITNKKANQLIQKSKRQYPGIIVDGTERFLSKPQIIVETVNRTLEKSGIEGIRARNYGKYLFLVGSPMDNLQKNLALKLARTIDRTIVDSMSKDTSTAPSIKIEVMFVEVTKSDLLTIGLKNPPIGGDNAIALAKGVQSHSNFSSGPINWVLNDFTFFLEMIRTSGTSRVLSQPLLVSRSGEKAEFHSGGTFYMESVQNVDGKKEIVINPVNHGIELNILPKVDKLGNIDANLNASVTDVVEAKIAGGLPSLAVSKISTAVTIKDGQSILISGLSKTRNSKEVSKVPLLGDVPVLGELFKSRKFEDENIELMVLVTMKVVKPSKESLSAAKGLWDHASRDVKFSIFD
ncbi:MAG: type II and III secretion system protein [Bacteriovoracaceae bacterium]|nr:type II and III secretion system protein [Bacteriovoracaceae bacterium]